MAGEDGKNRAAGMRSSHAESGCSGRCGLLARLLLGDLTLQLAGALGEFALTRLSQERVEAAAMLDRAQGMRRDPHADATAEYVGLHGHIDEVRQEPALRLAVRVAHEVADEHGLAGQFAAARHDLFLFWCSAAMRVQRAKARDDRTTRYPEGRAYTAGRGRRQAGPCSDRLTP